MRITLLTLFIFISGCLLSQSTVSKDTLSTSQGDLEIEYVVAGDYLDISEISIHQYTIEGSDTLSVFFGVFNVDEDDPSNFLTFTSDDSAGQYGFGIGEFTPSQFYSKVIVTKLTGLSEEFIFN